MRTRTKFTILAASMIFITLPVQLILSLTGKEMLSDGYFIAWISAWCGELLMCYGLKINSKGD